MPFFVMKTEQEKSTTLTKKYGFLDKILAGSPNFTGGWDPNFESVVTFEIFP